MPMLSVVIPVYQAEDGIHDCLQSLKNQSYQDFEVICINDGSTDSSAQIIESFCQGDSRFTLLNQDNAGVAAARNRGLEQAKGRFVTFVDADDTLPRDSFKYMHQATVVNDADTVCGIYERIDGVTKYTNARSSHLANKTRRIQRDDLDIIHSWSLCNKWLSRKIIAKHHVRFEKFSHLEDAVFLYSYLLHAEKIYACPHVVYTYRKPLSFVGRTTTQQANTRLVTSSAQAFRRIGELTESYGSQFAVELRYRYLNTPLIGDYYRRIWMYDDESAERVAREIDDAFGELDAAHREKILQNNFDIVELHGSLRKKDFLDAPLVSVVLTAQASEGAVPLFLQELYDQPCVSFSVLVSESFRKNVPSGLALMPNLSFFDGSAEDAIALAPGEYLAIVDDGVVYDHRSLWTMAKALYKNHELDYVWLRIAKLSVDGAKGVDVSDDAERCRACRLFRTESLRAKKSQDLRGERINKPVVLEVEEYAKHICGEKPSSVNARPSGKEKRVGAGLSLLRRGKRKVARMLGMNKKGKDSATEVESKRASTALDFYLNEEIDTNLIVLEGLDEALYDNLLREFQKPEYGRFNVAFSVTNETKETVDTRLAALGFSNAYTIVAGTDEYAKALFTTGYLFSALDFPDWWIKKPHQVYVSLWHGAPLEPLNKAKSNANHYNADALRNITMADYVLLPSKYVFDERSELGKSYDDLALIREFVSCDSSEKVARIFAATILGEDIQDMAKPICAHPVQPFLLVSDGLAPGPATDLLYALQKEGKLTSNVYVSFLESEVARHLESAYPLVRQVKTFATKGEALSERSEQQRLYGGLSLRGAVLLEPSSAQRIRQFARFDVPVYLCISESLLNQAVEDEAMLKALKLFKKWGNGLFSLSEGIAQRARDLLEADVELIADSEIFAKRFLANTEDAG